MGSTPRFSRSEIRVMAAFGLLGLFNNISKWVCTSLSMSRGLIAAVRGPEPPRAQAATGHQSPRRDAVVQSHGAHSPTPAGYVIMLAGANSISAAAVGLVYLAAVGPAILVKASGPYWFHRVGYPIRIGAAAALMTGSFCIVALSSSRPLQLLGVALASFQARGGACWWRGHWWFLWTRCVCGSAGRQACASTECKDNSRMRDLSKSTISTLAGRARRGQLPGPHHAVRAAARPPHAVEQRDGVCRDRGLCLGRGAAHVGRLVLSDDAAAGQFPGHRLAGDVLSFVAAAHAARQAQRGARDAG